MVIIRGVPEVFLCCKHISPCVYCVLATEFPLNKVSGPSLTPHSLVMGGAQKSQVADSASSFMETVCALW